MSDKVISETPEAITETKVEVTETKSPGEAPMPQEVSQRQMVEDAVYLENTTYPEPEKSEEAPKAETKAPETVTEKSPEERIKEKVQKRIDKVIAQKKSVEEELAEAKAELEKLKAQATPDKTEVKPSDKREPTDAEVDAAYAKALADGDYQFAAQINRFMVEREKAKAIETLKAEEDAKAKKQAEENARVESEWVSLNKDYEVYDESGKIDISNDLTLSNQNGLLYKTALALYKDPELQKLHYNDANKIQGFRRAVADAFREITSNLLTKQNVSPEKNEDTGGDTPKIETRKRAQLAVPGSEIGEAPAAPQTLSDAEKANDEIRTRRKFIAERARA